ncbi:MAG: carboxypeptidase regulatory-like domain-containing protein [Acidobacteria bacterium]|nr:carboxypeptidase regulatory-like domain-containing protein [Acidobacteriota bacterium]
MRDRLLTAVVLVAAFAGPTVFFAQTPGLGGPQGGGRGGAPIQRPPRDVREREVGTAVVRGRVQTADTGTPIRRAQIRAVSPGGRETRLVTTDAEGRFELRDLPGGRWELTASKGGYVTMRYGQRRPFEAGRPLELADGQVVQQVNFALPRGAVIAGRIVDEFGDAVTGARVQALRYQLAQGTRRLTPTGMVAQTDDTGSFRLYGLMPGDYYVSAILRALPADDTTDTTGYAPTYYPGTGSVTEAQPVALGVSEEATISFALQAVRTARISGSVITSTGVPLANGMMMLLARDGAGPSPLAFGAGNRIRPDGTFMLSNVAPGSYMLMASNGGPGLRGGGSGDIEIGTLPIAVAGDDVTGVTVVTGRGATLTGTVVAAQGSNATLTRTNLQVVTQVVDGGLGGFGGFPGLGGGPGPFGGGRNVAEDGTFTLTNLFGSRLVRLNGLPQEWMLESVIVDGRDVTDRPLEFAPNADITGARIVVTDRVTEVSGSVTSADGKSTTRDFTVVVFPDDETRWAAPSRSVRSARPDQQGLFKIRALPPDDRYLAVAVDYLEQGEETDAELLASLKAQATAFRLRPGDRSALSLRLVER